MLTRRVRIGLAANIGLGALIAVPAMASGPNELMAQVTLDPDRPDRLVVRYQNGASGTRRGLILSDDAGKSWRVMCSDAIHEQVVASGLSLQINSLAAFKFDVRRMHSVMLAKGGATLINTPVGLLVGDAQSCGFRAAPEFLERNVNQLLEHPSQAGVYFALDGWDESGPGMWRRAEDGAWARFGEREPAAQDGKQIVIKSAALAKNEADVRVYQTVWRLDADAGAARSFVRVSDDGAQSWQEYPLAPALSDLEVLAIDPTQRERVLGVIRRGGDDNERAWSDELDTLMLSEDGGQSFRAYFEVAGLGEVAFGVDGSLWIADAGARVGEETRAGLFRAASGLASAPVQLSADPYQCVTYAPGTQRWYACQGTRVGTLDAQTGAFEPLVRLDSVDSLATCPGLDTKRVCQDQLCTAGYCLLTHYPLAPACIVYDSMLCGPSSVRDRADAAVEDAASADAASPDAASAPEGDGAGETPTMDAGTEELDASLDDVDAAPPHDGGDSGCDCRVSARGAGPARALGWLGLAALWLARRRRVPR